MRIITGDETGLIKQVLIENKRIVFIGGKKVIVQQRWGTQTRVNSAERMVWAGEEGSEENEIAVARKSTSYFHSLYVGMEVFRFGMWIVQPL